MHVERLRELAGPIVGFSLSTVVIPAGLAALGVPWPIVLSAGLLLTVVVALLAYPQWRDLSVPAAVGAALLAGWSINREAGYSLTYQFCRKQTLQVNSGEPRLAVYELAIRIFNDSGYKLWGRVDQQSLAFGTKVAETPADRATLMPIFPGTRELVRSGTVRYVPAIALSDVPPARFRFLVRFGRDSEKLRKTLVASGTAHVVWLQNGDTRLDLQLDPDSDMPVSFKDVCRLPNAA